MIHFPFAAECHVMQISVHLGINAIHEPSGCDWNAWRLDFQFIACEMPNGNLSPCIKLEVDVSIHEVVLISLHAFRSMQAEFNHI